MPVFGDLGTMGLTDLLQWVGLCQHTGVLEIERSGVTKRIEFRKGYITSCCSSDRPNQLGQFLLSRGKITPEQIDEATERQKHSGQRLGWILLEMGLMNEKEIARFVAASVEETMQVLFDWRDAAFRFFQGATLSPQQVEVSLAVNDVLLRGIQFQDELKRFREVFTSSGVVLLRTDKPAPDELLSREISRRIFESIDGDRTIADVLRNSNASEQLVLKLLYRLYQMQLVEIIETRSVEELGGTLLDPIPRKDENDSQNGAQASAAGLALAPDLPVELEAARRLMRRNEFSAAVELLNAAFRAHPGNYDVGAMLSEAEVGFVTTCVSGDLSPTSIPFVVQRDVEMRESDEAFLLSLIDGRFDVQSLMSLATLREHDVLQTLERMLDRGVIALRDMVEPAQPHA